MTYAWIGLALGLLAFAPISYVLSPRLRLRLNTRIAVEVVRWRTRKYEPHHGDTYLGMHWHEQVVPYAQVNGEPPWATSPPLRALPPVPDRLDDMVAAANAPGWHGEGRDRYYIIPDEELVVAADLKQLTVNSLTPNQAAGYWEPHPQTVLSQRVVDALLGRPVTDDTVVSGRDLEYMTGGDPFDGHGRDGYLDAFDVITRQAHAAIDRIRVSIA